jgi:DNA-binding response OmpR family regulator
MMPMLNGDRKVRLLKERESSRNIPILLMSTKPREELEILARASGADGYVLKPFNNRSLIQHVDRILAA